MSLFRRIFDATSHVAEDFESFEDGLVRAQVAADPAPTPTPFMAYVKDALLHGKPEEPSYPEESFDYEDDLYGESFYETEEQEEDWDYSEEVVEDDDEVLDLPVEPSEPLQEEEPLPTETTTLVPRETDLVRENPNPGVVQVTSVEQKDDAQVERIVDGLFDKMRVVWGDSPQPKQPIREQAEPKRKRRREPPQKNYPLAESKAEIAKMIRHEVPQAMKGELVTLVRTEIMKAVRGEIVRVVRDELEAVSTLMKKTLERLHAIEARMAKIEGSVDREVKVNFPEGAVKIDAPITVPEREVKVAAPINVQPPHLTLDEGAITVNFNKTGGGKKEVRFERDPHDPSCVKSAEIIDVSTGK